MASCASEEALSMKAQSIFPAQLTNKEQLFLLCTLRTPWWGLRFSEVDILCGNQQLEITMSHRTWENATVPSGRRSLLSSELSKVLCLRSIVYSVRANSGEGVFASRARSAWWAIQIFGSTNANKRLTNLVNEFTPTPGEHGESV